MFVRLRLMCFLLKRLAASRISPICSAGSTGSRYHLHLWVMATPMSSAGSGRAPPKDADNNKRKY